MRNSGILQEEKADWALEVVVEEVEEEEEEEEGEVVKEEADQKGKCR